MADSKSGSARSSLYITAVVATTVAAFLWTGTVALEAVQSFARPAQVVYVNTKTGAQLVVKRPSLTLRAMKDSKMRKEAAKLAFTGVLSVAAVAQPVHAMAQSSQLADLMLAWNQEFGAEYGRWEMTGERFPVRTAPQLVGQPPKAAAVPLRTVTSAVGTIDQVVAEWNKDFGAEYGTWQQLTPTTPAAKVAQMITPAMAKGTLATKVDAPVVIPSSMIGLIAWGLAGLSALLSVIYAAKWASNRNVQSLLKLLPQEELPAPGEYSFAMDTNGRMRLVTARRDPRPVATEAVPEPSLVQPPSHRGVPRLWHPQSWAFPTSQLAGAMVVTSGERRPSQEVYDFTLGPTGNGMKLVKTEAK